MSIEDKIVELGLTAPRIRPVDIEDNILEEHYFVVGDVLKKKSPVHEISVDLLTVCVIILKNGFTVTGESACASPENFNREIGKDIARKNAIDKVWPLMGYNLKQKLFEENV